MQQDTDMNDGDKPSTGLLLLQAHLAEDMKARELANSKEKRGMQGNFQERKVYTQDWWMFFRAWMTQNATRKLDSRESRKSRGNKGT